MARFKQKLVMADEAQPGEHHNCPACQAPVQLRRGKQKVAHFDHFPGAECGVGEGETSEHLIGKRQLWKWLSKAGYEPSLEVYLPKINQRPDLLFRDRNQQPIAIEFQCSPLQLSRLSERNRGYQQLGIHPYWLLGRPYRHQLSRKKQAQFTQLVGNQLTLLYWDTVNERVDYYQDLGQCSFNCRASDRNAIIRRQIKRLLKPAISSSQVKRFVGRI